MHFNAFQCQRCLEQCCRRMLPTLNRLQQTSQAGQHYSALYIRSTTGPHHTRTSLMRTMQGKCVHNAMHSGLNSITHTNLYPAEHEMNISTNWKLVLHDSSYDSPAILAFDTLHIERAAHNCLTELLYSILSNELNGAAMQQRTSGRQTKCSCMHSPLLA